MTEEKCDYCGGVGQLGRDIRAFRFRTPKGIEVLRFLHPTDDERRCFHEYEAKYKAWIEQQKTKAVTHG